MRVAKSAAQVQACDGAEVRSSSPRLKPTASHHCRPNPSQEKALWCIATTTLSTTHRTSFPIPNSDKTTLATQTAPLYQPTVFDCSRRTARVATPHLILISAHIFLTPTPAFFDPSSAAKLSHQRL